jgi:hypothetical protein
MKMKAKLALVIFLFTFFVTGIMVRAEEQTREVDPFTSISLRVSANLHLGQGEKQSIEIVAKPSTLEEILTEVKDGELIIRFPNKNYFWNSFQPGDITIYITIPEIDGLSVSGSGDIVAEDEIKTDKINLALSGSGSIKISELSAEQVKTSISGSGNIVLAGKKVARDFSVSISGSGNMKGLDFIADYVTVRVSGSGNVGIQANKNLFVRISGSGNVTYKGEPMIDSSISGSGKVKSVE